MNKMNTWSYSISMNISNALVGCFLFFFSMTFLCHQCISAQSPEGSMLPSPLAQEQGAKLCFAPFSQEIRVPQEFISQESTPPACPLPRAPASTPSWEAQRAVPILGKPLTASLLTVDSVIIWLQLIAN